MSEGGINAARVSSVLGYCLLPLCLLSAINVFVRLECVPTDQRLVRLHYLAAVRSLVLYFCIGHLCLDPRHAQPARTGCLPRRSILCMLRAA